VTRFAKDQSKAIQRLQALVKQLQDQQSGRDEALLAAVQKLVRNVYTRLCAECRCIGALC
jgi:hypothetical protein